MPDREELRRRLREKRRQARGGQPADPRAALERQVMEMAGDDPALLRMARANAVPTSTHHARAAPPTPQHPALLSPPSLLARHR